MTKWIFIKQKTWMRRYKPLGGGFVFGNFDKDTEYLRKTDKHYIWTDLDAGEGSIIVNGSYGVNSMGWYITEVPWNDGEEIRVQVPPGIPIDPRTGEEIKPSDKSAEK